MMAIGSMLLLPDAEVSLVVASAAVFPALLESPLSVDLCGRAGNVFALIGDDGGMGFDEVPSK